MSRLNTKRRRQRGNVAILSALLLTMLLGFAALAVDMSNKYRVRTESQSAADAAALAGAGQLRGTPEGLFEAQRAARAVGEKHYAYQSNVTVAEADIELGEWSFKEGTFTPGVASERTNAVRVQHQEAAVAHPFASPLTGSSSSAVSAVATAVGGGPSSVTCPFPMALGSCTLQGGAGNNNCGGCLKPGKDKEDNIGWSNFDGNISNPEMASLLKAACFAADGTTPALDSEGRCTGACGTKHAAGEDMQLGNGNDFNTDPDKFCELVKSLLRASPTHTVRTQVPVFEASGAECDPKFSGTAPAIGFAEVELLGARCGNGDKDFVVPPKSAGCEDATAEKYLIARVSCGTQTDLPAGGRLFGLSARPVLVK